MNIKIEKASGNDVTLVVTPQANQKIIIDRNIKGDVGATGATGATGAAGVGVAISGTTGQVLTKLSNTNYDTGWTTNGNGTVTSVSGTGLVNGISLSGTVTSSGNLTLGGALSGIANNQLTNSSITINGTAIALGGTVSTPQGTVTSVTATSPVTSTGGTTPIISMPFATTSISGYLTNTDWNIFNNKLSTQVYPSAGIPNSTGTAWGTSYSVTGTGNVVLNTLPTISIYANALSLQDNVDPTKIAKFDLSALVTGTSNTYTLPSTSSVLATTSNIAQTFTGAFTVSPSTATSTINIGAASGTGQISIGRSAAGQTIVLGSSTTGTSQIDIGRTKATLTVNVGAAINTSPKTINIGTGSGGATTYIWIGEPNFESITTISGLMIQGVYTLSTIPVPSSGYGGFVAGCRSFISDGLAPTFGAIAVGGGAVNVPVYYDGTNWRVG